MAEYVLPYQDELGFTNILMSALGGDGANMAAKLLFKIAVEKLDLDGGYDAKYGSEKTGTPTDVSIRLCRSAHRCGRVVPPGGRTCSVSSARS